MNKTEVDTLARRLHSHAAGFYTDDSKFNAAIRLKEEHTARVRSEIADLGHALKLSPDDMFLAEAVAILHDIGRFRQYARYRTFNDGRSENHALLGVRYLVLNKVLAMCSKSEARLISKAVAYHNAAELPPERDERTLFFMRLLRDADKLDIWRIALDHYQGRSRLPERLIDHGLPDDGVCSPAVLESLEKLEIVRIQNVRSLCDLKLLQIGWVFDLNFIPSLLAVRRRRYVEQIEATLPRSEPVQHALRNVHRYVVSVLDEAVRPGRSSGLIGERKP